MLPTELKQFLNPVNIFAGAPLRDLLDPDKASLLRAIRPHANLSWRALSGLYDAACAIERERVSGDIVACGDSTGAAAALVSSVVENGRERRVWVFETAADSAGLFHRLFLNPRNKMFARGLSPVQKKQEIGAIALLVLGSREPLEDLFDQVVSGGWVAIEAADRSRVEEFLAARGARTSLMPAEGLVLFRKN